MIMTPTARPTRSLATHFAILTLLTIGALTGCQSVVDSPASQQTGSDEQAQPSPRADETESDPAPSNPTIAFDWQEDAPEAGSDAFLAWQALMGPDGEFAALASYQAVLDAFGPVEPYLSISEAEARHAGALIRQLERMGVAVPDNPYLGQIDPPADLEAAAAAWAEGEVLNVALYDELLAQTDDDRLVRVFTNLRRASAEQHLPAFERAADNGGVLDSSDMATWGGQRG